MRINLYPVIVAILIAPLMCLSNYNTLPGNGYLFDAINTIVILSVLSLYIIYWTILYYIILYPFSALCYYYNNIEHQCHKSFISQYNANITLTLDPDCLRVEFLETPSLDTHMHVYNRNNSIYNFKQLTGYLSDEQKQRYSLVYKNTQCWYDGDRVTFDQQDVNLHPIQTVNLSDPIIYKKYANVMQYPCDSVINPLAFLKYGVPLFLICCFSLAIVGVGLDIIEFKPPIKKRRSKKFNK